MLRANVRASQFRATLDIVKPMLDYLRALKPQRDHWSVLALAGIAVALVVAGLTLSNNPMAAAGYGFIGATIVRIVDINQQRGRDRAADEAARRRDLDETRRLIYMLLIEGDNASSELRATTLNALAHHGLEVPIDEIVKHLAPSVAAEDSAENLSGWLRAQLAQINNRLTSGHLRRSEPICSSPKSDER